MDPAVVARLTLARPAATLAPSYFAFIDEMRAVRDTVWPTRVPRDGESVDDFVAGLLAKETTAPAVPESVYWGVVDEHVVGFIALRHQLNDKLARFGGHVGYEVRPSWRRRGVATTMLRRLLATDRARTMRRILVTCAPDNAASRRAIERNGGVLADVVHAEEIQRDTCRYWIDVDVRRPVTSRAACAVSSPARTPVARRT